MEIEALLNIDFNKLLTNIITMLTSIVLFVITRILVFLFISFILALFFSFNLYFYIKKRNREKRFEEIKNGKTYYPSMEIDINDFINVCRKGLPNSIVKIDKDYYQISIVLYEDPITEKYKFIATINNNQFKSIEALLNYKINNKKIKDYDSIIIMEIEGKNPKDYFLTSY